MGAYVEGVLLAAGESRRMGFPKPLLLIDGQTFIARLCETLLAELPRLLVVVGAHAQRLRPAIVANSRLEIIENPDYALGQLSSLKAALKAVSPDADAVLVHPADQPLICRQTVAALVKAYAGAREKIVIARYQDRRGHPVIFDRSLFCELAQAPDQVGARAVVRRDPARVNYVDVNDSGVITDFDFPDDLARAGLAAPPCALARGDSSGGKTAD